MIVRGTAFFILSLTLSSWECFADNDFVNPSDLLNFDPVKIKMNNEAEETVDHETYLNHEQKIPDDENVIKSHPVTFEHRDGNMIKDETSIHVEKNCPAGKDEALKSIFKRYLMSLVQHIENRIDSPNDSVEFCMKMKASHEDITLLKLYGTGGTDDVHKIHERLEKMMLYTTELPNEGPIYWLEAKSGLSTSTLLLVIAVLLLVIIVGKILSSVRITRSLITKWIIIAFVCSCAVTYFELYQQKVADQEKVLSDDITERCPHLSQSTWMRFTGYFTSSFTFQDEHCREYYEAVVVHPFLKVSLLEAGAIAITKTFMAPMKILGNGIKDFIVGLFKDLPAQFSFWLFVILLEFLIFLPFLTCGYTVKIPFILTLQSPTAQKCLQPQETKAPHCITCNHDKDQVKEIEERRSIYLKSPTPPAPVNALSSCGVEKRQINKPTRNESVRGDSGDHDQVYEKSSEVQDKSRVQEIIIKLKSCDISTALDESGSPHKAERKLKEECVELENKDQYSVKHDGPSAFAEEGMPADDNILSESCVTNGNAVSSSDFFVAHEARSCDVPCDNGPDPPDSIE